MNQEAKRRMLEVTTNQADYLSLMGIELGGFPVEIVELTHLQSLDLDSTGLDQLLPEVVQLSGLAELYLSRNNFSELPSEISQLSNLTVLDLSNNQLSKLSPGIVHLSNLTVLDLSNNQLSRLPSEIGQLSNLAILDLRGNQLSKLPPEIGQLSNLTALYLNNNKLSDLPLEIVRLSNLTVLGLNSNQLEKLPPEIVQLVNLTQLNLNGNQLSELPSEIVQLGNLTVLYLNSNKLSDLPPEIIRLSNLIGLDLSNNQLSRLPSEIGQLSNLSQLYLSGNQLKRFPPEIVYLSNLSRLYLYNNQLRELPPEIVRLRNLVELDLRDNQLSELPPEIVRLIALSWFWLDGNPLLSPPSEIAKQGIGAINTYFKTITKETEILRELKVLLVGEGSVGKTSLVKQLLDETFDKHERTTHGIRIREWYVQTDAQKMKVNLWDFGGQEIMHATHQFFLSKRSLYLLVLDGRRDERPEYWLRQIESVGGDSPILVVLNKYDANPSYDVNRTFLQRKYPHIVGIYRTSCETGYGIEQLKVALTSAFGRVKLVGTRLANSWLNVKRRLETLNKPFIDYEQYEAICRSADVTTEISQMVLVDFLHDLGVIVHFREFDLEDTHVLEPRWVTTAVYKIINSEIVARNHGVLHLRDMKTILRKTNDDAYTYPRNKYRYIIKLMQKFELCYDLDKKRVLIPQLLAVREPQFDFAEADALHFLLDYGEFLPRSIMPRFIVKRHRDIKGDLRWRSGVVLENSAFDATAVMRADNEANRIHIMVSGTQRKDYLAVLRFTFYALHDSFEILPVDERVPMPDNPTLTVSYQTLLNYQRNGMSKIIPDGTVKAYTVADLLGLVRFETRDDLQEVLSILQRLEASMGDDESLLSKREATVSRINRIIDLKPNAFGVGINLNAAIEELLANIVRGRRK